MARAPEKGVAPNPAPPTVCRVRIRFAKRGRLRFSSHRDVARAFERAVRRASLPVAHSHGFSPHPRLSWVGAAPTGTASEAEYLEIGLTLWVEPAGVVAALDAALPVGLDVLDAVESTPGTPALADLIDATRWRIRLPGVEPAELAAAVAALLEQESVVVQRATKSGHRPVDVRASLVSLAAHDSRSNDFDLPNTASGDATGQRCATMTAVVRQTTPAVRPDDVLGALLLVAGLRPPVPPMAVRLAQGLLDGQGCLVDPLAASRVSTSVGSDGSGAQNAPSIGQQHGAAN